jgi:hypothetical protein
VDSVGEDEVRERRRQGLVSGRIWVQEWTVGRIWIREGRSILGWIWVREGRISGHRRDLASVGIPTGDPTGFLKPKLAKCGFLVVRGER